MTSTVEPANTNGLLPTKAHDGRTMVGHVVVTPGRDEHAEDAVAVWQVDTSGNSTGAWVHRLDLDEPDPSTTERVLRLCPRRAVVAWQPAETISLLGRLAEAADLAMPAWSHTP